MSHFRNKAHFVPLLALIGGLISGCNSTKSGELVTSYLPSSPRPTSAHFSVTPPSLEPLSSSVRLRLVPRPFPRITPVVDATRTIPLARAADFHFQMGKKRFQEGDEAAARTAFDRAIEALLSPPEDLTPAERAVIDKKLDELASAIHRLDLTVLGAADISEEPGFEKALIEEIPPMTFPIDPALRDKVLEEVRATTSQLPLQVNDAVLGYVHYFSSERGRRVVAAGLRRAGRYKPLVQRILDEEGVPQELIYIAQAESGFQPRAVSTKAATGMWQFMRLRGREYGLMQTAYTDDRLDPEKATRAAARHLRDLYQQFGDWYLAMAAYNAGPGTIAKAVERTGYADFWELRKRAVLPKETCNYVPIILAMTIVAKNTSDHGLDTVESDPPLEYDAIEVEANTSLQLLSDLLDCPVAQLRELNPALLKNIAPAKYMLRVPKGTSSAVLSALDNIPAERRQTWRAHRVVEGDTTRAMALRYRVSEQSILAANPMLADGLEAGDLVRIPTKASAPAVKKVATRTSARKSQTAAKKTNATRKTAAKKKAVTRTSAKKKPQTTAKKTATTARKIAGNRTISKKGASAASPQSPKAEALQASRHTSKRTSRQ